MRRKHSPQRMCVVCRVKMDKRLLTRVVRGDDGVVVDPTGKMNGRGAYVCDKLSCRKKAVTSKILDQALKKTLSIEEKNQLAQLWQTDEF